MKHLLNTLFVTTEDIYLSLDGENVVANQDRKELARYPLHTLEGIVSFSYSGASPALMGGLRGTKRFPGLLHATGALPGQNHWEKHRECPSPADPVPGGR